MNMKTDVERRRFLLSAAGGMAGVALSGGAGEILAAPQAWSNRSAINPSIPNTRVVCCYDTRMITNQNPASAEAANAAVNRVLVEQNMDEMAMRLTGVRPAATAWDTIFQKPAGKEWSQVKVAIKVNCMNVVHMARIAVINKVCTELIRKGVQASRITLYDAGSGAQQTAVVYNPFKGKGLPSDIVIQGPAGQLSNAPVPAPAAGSSRCATFIYDGSTDLLVNIASNGGHPYGNMGFFTVTMKNHYGTFTSRCDSTDYLIAINRSDAILGGTPPRQQLCIVDSLWARRLNDVFRAPDVVTHRLVMGTFGPIVDYLTVKRIREDVMKVTTHNQTVLNRFLSDFGYTASELQWIAFEGGTVPAAPRSADHSSVTRRTRIVEVARAGGRIQFPDVTMELPAGPAHLTMLDMQGNVIRRYDLPANMNRVLWDGSTEAGAPVRAGSYVCTATVAGVTRRARLRLVRV